MDKRYQIFISSTYTDLKEERDKVMRAVLQLKCFPVGMELFPAVNIKQFEYIKSVIDECDYYILIIGSRYGSIDKDGVSYTEKEYNYAVRKKIPVLAFLHSDFKSLLGKADVDKELFDKLEKFRKKVEKGGRLVNFWDSADDLRAKVSVSLQDAFNLHKRVGWVKANALNNDDSQKEITRLQQVIEEQKASYEKIIKDGDTLYQSALEKIKDLEAELKSIKTSGNCSNDISSNIPQIESFKVGDVIFNMVHVEGGIFKMGATPEQGKDFDDNEKPVHQVSLSDYWIGETPVTQALWETVMDENPSKFKGNPNRPVECVSWNDCRQFIRKLSKITGKKFRLPSEAEWEFAARGGKKSNNSKFAGSKDIEDVAWYDDNSHEETHPVAQLSPNELGIYDMSGNVWEWCQDRFGPYSTEVQNDPIGPDEGPHRIFRGGSWYGRAWFCRVSKRGRELPVSVGNYLGLRLAL